MIVHTLLDSSNLAGNPRGDPSERDLFVYLPPGYEEPDPRFPTAGPSPAQRGELDGVVVVEPVEPVQARRGASTGERSRPEEQRCRDHSRVPSDRTARDAQDAMVHVRPRSVASPRGTVSAASPGGRSSLMSVQSVSASTISVHGVGRYGAAAAPLTGREYS